MNGKIYCMKCWTYMELDYSWDKERRVYFDVHKCPGCGNRIRMEFYLDDD